MIDPSQMQGGGGTPPMMGPESLLALLAGAAVGQLAGQPGMGGPMDQQGQAQPSGGGGSSSGPQGQAKGEGTAVGQSSMGQILPQLLQAMAGQSPTTAAGAPGKSAAQGAQTPRPPQQAQEPMGLQILRMLGYVR